MTGARAPRVLVAGAGGVGGYFGALLSRAGYDVSFVARGAHAAAMREHGLTIVEGGASWTATEIRVLEDPRALGPMDLVLVCVKSYDTIAAARLLEPCVDGATIVLSLQNGVENEEILARELRLPPLLVAVTYIGSTLAAPGRIAYSGGAEIVFGEPAGAPSERTDRVAAWLAGAGVTHRVSRRILAVAWDKLAWNAAFNAVSTLTRRSVREVLADGGEALVRAAMREVLDVAHGLGIEVPVRIDEAIARSRDRLPDFHTSMLQDLERGRRLEVDALNGVVVRLGRRARVPTPIHATLATLLQLLDRSSGADDGRPAGRVSATG